MSKQVKKLKPEVKITEEEATKFLLEQQEKEKQEIFKDIDVLLKEKYQGKYSLGIRWAFDLFPAK